MALKLSADKTSVQSPFRPDENAQVQDRFKVEEVKGEFFGTDFNFLYSEEMQKAFANNCLSQNWDLYMKF